MDRHREERKAFAYASLYAVCALHKPAKYSSINFTLPNFNDLRFCPRIMPHAIAKPNTELFKRNQPA